MDEEQAIRIVLSLDFHESLIVAAPVRLLKSVLEVVAFADVRAAVWRNLSKTIHTSTDELRRLSPFRDRWLMACNSGIRRTLAVGRNHQRESVENRRVGRRILCRCD